MIDFQRACSLSDDLQKRRNGDLFNGECREWKKRQRDEVTKISWLSCKTDKECVSDDQTDNNVSIFVVCAIVYDGTDNNMPRKSGL